MLKPKKVKFVFTHTHTHLFFICVDIIANGKICYRDMPNCGTVCWLRHSVTSYNGVLSIKKLQSSQIACRRFFLKVLKTLKQIS